MTQNNLKFLCKAKNLNKYLTEKGFSPAGNKSGSHVSYKSAFNSKTVSLPLNNGLKSDISIGVVRQIVKIVEG